MSDGDYTTSFSVDQTPEEAFDAINNVRGWWSGEIEGASDKVGSEFTYRFKDMHVSKQRVTSFVPGKQVVWHVEEGYLSFVNDKTEWTGTDIVFDISEQDGKTQVHFTHKGLQPQVECYDKCSDAWGSLVRGNLRQLIITGQVQPAAF